MSSSSEKFVRESHTVTTTLILASQSPRRRQLLTEAGYVFTVIPPDEHVETPIRADESPQDYVQRLAKSKAENVAQKISATEISAPKISDDNPESCDIIGCDTVVLCEGRILGKPADENDARNMLTMLRGTEHTVWSGLCVLRMTGRQSELRGEIRGEVRSAVTRLLMLPIADHEIERYLRSGDWHGKAGALGYQDGHAWLTILEGSESNVVGLPLELLHAMLFSPIEP